MQLQNVESHWQKTALQCGLCNWSRVRIHRSNYWVFNAKTSRQLRVTGHHVFITSTQNIQRC